MSTYSQKNRDTNISEIIFLILFPLFLVLLISNVGFLLNYPIQKYYYPVFFIISCVLSKIYINSDNYTFAKNVFISVIIILISFFISGCFYDLSYDGQTYHQEAIILLKEGWNPVFEDPTRARTGALWVKHYPKGIEVIQAVTYKLTNKIEMGKTINILLIICSFLMSLICFEKLNLKRYKNYIYSFLIAVNPICISQVFTYYVDGVFYSLIVCLILSFILINKHIIYYFIFGGSLLLALSIKFTSIPVMGIITVLLLLYLLITKKQLEFKRLFFTCFLGLICFIIITFNPYITNLSEGKHVFYPLMGEKKVDIITPFVPEYFNDLNRFEKFTVSLFSKSGQSGGDIIKIPFTVYTTELNRLADSDIGVGGFGVFYSGIMILTLALLLLFLIKNKLRFNKTQYFIFYLIFMLFLAVFIIPEPFWFRYIPHFYLIPILFLLIIEISIKENTALFKFLTNVIIGFYFLNLALFFGAIFSKNIYETAKINYQLKQIKDKNITIKVEYPHRGFPSNSIRFEENNIPYRVGHFMEDEKYIVIPPYEKTAMGTKIEYFEYNSEIEKGFLYLQLDKFFSKYEGTL